VPIRAKGIILSTLIRQVADLAILGALLALLGLTIYSVHLLASLI